MIFELLKDVKSVLTDAGIEPVYFNFDKVSRHDKDNPIITIGLESYELTKPILTSCLMYLPFTSGVEVVVTVPESYTLSALYTYFNETVLPVLRTNPKFSAEFVKCCVTRDENLKRLKLTADITVHGVATKGLSDLHEKFI